MAFISHILFNTLRPSDAVSVRNGLIWLGKILIFTCQTVSKKWLGICILYHFSTPKWCRYLKLKARTCLFNTSRPRQDGRHFADDIFKCIFMNENVWIPIKISLKFVPKGPINNIPALVQIMAWRRPGDKPLSEPMMVSLPTHICVSRPQWVNTLRWLFHECW